LPKSQVIGIFSKLQARYTHKWNSAIDDDEIYELALVDWQEELAGLTSGQITYGLANLPKSWPPTSGEFKDLCEGKKETWQHNTAAYLPLEKSKALPAPRNKKLARKALAKIKLTLKGNINVDVVDI